MFTWWSEQLVFTFAMALYSRSLCSFASKSIKLIAYFSTIPRPFFLNFMLLCCNRICKEIKYEFFDAYEIPSTVDVCHIFTGSNDESTKTLLVLAYEFVNICQTSIIHALMIWNFSLSWTKPVMQTYEQ